ncbi:MAG: hypothetical protein ABJA83_02480 [Burkholderiaceae bacterium]
MNRFKTLSASLLLMPALALVSAPARAEFKCDASPLHFDRTACEKAKESPQALRLYIQRVRMIYNLQFSDYVNETQERVWAQNESNTTAAKPAPVQSARFSQENPGA